MLRFGIVLVLLAGCGAAPSQNASTYSAPLVSTQGGDVNELRRAAGLPGLFQSAQLEAIARGHAADMERNGFFSHTGSDGRSVGERTRAAGYSYCRVAENIAQGQDSRAEVMRDWYDSPKHRVNLLNRDVTEYGLARVGNDQWVMVLARPGCKNGRPVRG